jgi:hypothetical protein
MAARFAVFVALVALLPLASCFTIRIGSVLSLTGPHAAFMADVARGVCGEPSADTVVTTLGPFHALCRTVDRLPALGSDSQFNERRPRGKFLRY